MRHVTCASLAKDSERSERQRWGRVCAQGREGGAAAESRPRAGLRCPSVSLLAPSPLRRSHQRPHQSYASMRERGSCRAQLGGAEAALWARDAARCAGRARTGPVRGPGQCASAGSACGTGRRGRPASAWLRHAALPEVECSFTRPSPNAKRTLL